MRRALPSLDWRLLVAGFVVILALGGFWFFHEPGSRTLTDAERKRAEATRAKFAAEHPEVYQEMAKRGMR